MGKARRGGVVASAVVSAGRQLRSEGVVSLGRVVEVLGAKHVVWVPEVVEGRQAVRDGRAHAQARMRVTWRSTVDGSEIVSTMVGEAWVAPDVEAPPLVSMAQDSALAQVASRVLGVDVAPERWLLEPAPDLEPDPGPGDVSPPLSTPGFIPRVVAVAQLADALSALEEWPVQAAEAMADLREWGSSVRDGQVRLALEEVERRESVRLRGVTGRSDPARTSGGVA